nr:porin family protein [uncultured Psychroserpens sp.]
MKKLLTIILFASLGMFNLNAQSDKGDIELGLGIGFNYSNVVVGSDAEDATDSKTGLNVAAVGEYYFSDRWGIKAKLIYDQKGWGNGFFENENGVFTTDYNINYLTIPVMANWHFGSTRKWYLNFGPYLGLLLNAETANGGIDVKEGISSTDFGIAYGIGYKFDVADNTKLYIEWDGQAGFSDVFEESNSNSSVRNGRGSFNVGVLFNL